MHLKEISPINITQYRGAQAHSFHPVELTRSKYVHIASDGNQANLGNCLASLNTEFSV
jgi:hypothetical protein